MILRPNPGKQEAFLSTPADIALYGGSAGGGKTMAILMESLRNINNPRFTCTILRRNMTDIKKTGALWDEASNIYPQLGGISNKQEMTFRFPTGAKVQFGHVENENTIYTYQGSQICLLCFDELTHFTENQFWYLLSRNRSSCGIKPYVRATCNPDKDSFVRKLVDWWIDPNTGYAIESRSGIIRYFIRHDKKLVWADNQQELIEYGIKNNIQSIIADKEKVIKSFTFIPANLIDNQILMEQDPNYRSNLEAQNKIEKERLLYGNWNISYSDYGVVLSRDDFFRYDLKEKLNVVGYFTESYFVVDSASTTKTSSDYSVIIFIARSYFDKRYYIIDLFRDKLQEPDLEQKIIDLWQHWKSQKVGQNYIFTPQSVNIENKSSGISMLQRLPRHGIPCFQLEAQKDKFLRLNDCLGIIKSKFVGIPNNAPWADKFLEECEAFRADLKHVIMNEESIPHDDQVDCLAYALSSQINQKTPISVYQKPEPQSKRFNLYT